MLLPDENLCMKKENIIIRQLANYMRYSSIIIIIIIAVSLRTSDSQ